MNLSERDNSSQIVTTVEIPQDLVWEILMKMKAKDLCKFITVSKYWRSIISSKDFTNLYMTRSMSQPRILFSLPRRDNHNNMRSFYSCSQIDPPADDYTIRCNPLNQQNGYEFSPPVHGLISCVNDDKEVMIGNPSTCQFITLPKINISGKHIISFFGYDSNAGEYKVMCMTVLPHRFETAAFVPEEYYVFTLGNREKQWKMIKCEHPHYVFNGTQGIYNDGVVYYQAWINHVDSLMCFDVASEKFSVIKLPKDTFMSLSNYGKKIAVTHRALHCGVSELWILEDTRKQVWSHVSISIPYCSDLSSDMRLFWLRGTLGTGELIFEPFFPTPLYFLLCYDLKKKKVRKIWIEGIGHSDGVKVFLDHVESPMFLQL